MKKSIWSMYIVQCSKGAYYIGISNDVPKRIQKHNTGKGAKCMIMLGTPVVLMYVEEVGTYSQALKRERQVKKYTRKKKEELIKSKLDLTKSQDPASNRSTTPGYSGVAGNRNH